ncbi:L,D-transpeptidase family protein [Nocardioides sp.]|uniref:L,D-transpeptidase family protein n=1 Tax=Nocardioides sp. TaxID=35761 RepID=UPI003519B3B6
MTSTLGTPRRLALVAVGLASAVTVAGTAAWAVEAEGLPWSHADTSSAPRAAAPVGSGAPAPTPRPAPTSAPATPPTSAPTSAPTPPASSATPTPTTPPAGPAVLSPGDRSAQVRDLQARLRQIDWFSGDVTDLYGERTTAAVRGFQAKRGFEATGVVDRRTLDRLAAMTRTPSADELANRRPSSDANTPGPLDPRCTSGRVLCIDKSSRTLRWVVDGVVRTSVDVRFGADTTPTREGSFSVQRKSRDHVSTIYHSSMPYAMFFSGGQAVHYSSDFAQRGYAGASHGCVNVRDLAAVRSLFDQVEVGDRVVVYRS